MVMMLSRGRALARYATRARITAAFPPVARCAAFSGLREPAEGNLATASKVSVADMEIPTEGSQFVGLTGPVQLAFRLHKWPLVA